MVLYSLDLKNNAEHKSLYSQLSEVLATYDLRDNGESLLDLSGTILKYFSSCTHYHCREILAGIIDIEREAERNLIDVPIIWIVSRLKSGIQENMGFLINGFNGLGGKYEFKFEEHISINWGRTQSYLANDDEEELFGSHYLDEEREIQMILSEFQKKWNVKINELDNDYYSVKFLTNRHFQKFRNYALKLAQPHYIFEGDVIDMVGDPNLVGGMVELKVAKIFDVPHTVAKIIGRKKIEG